MGIQKHTLEEYVRMLEEEGLLAGPAPEGDVLLRSVELVSCDSNNVCEGTLFLCKGAHFKEAYLVDAASKGAFAYLSDQAYPNVDLPCILLNDVRTAMARLATMYYNDPWRRVNVTGITGTKGKSSTSYYVKSVLDEWMKQSGGKETGVLGSVDTYDGVERFESHLTTPEPLDLQRHLSNCEQSGTQYMTMEVSSQALKYDRMLGMRLSVACFLNIGYDHISGIEHPDWEDYFESKLRIFELSDVGIVNLDSEHIDRILEASKASERVVTFSEHDEAADVYAYDVHKQDEDTVFRVRTPRFDREFRLSMPGLFNVQNALAAISICLEYGVPERAIYTGLMKARVPGRMEVYANADRRVVAIVDYAHNRLSFEKLFQSVREEYPGRRVVIVFGCPGKKALDRRHDLGQIAGQYSDHVYITEEDPGEEDALEIAREIAVSVAAEGCPYSINVDRGEAIMAAVMDSEEESVVLITGKGAETREKRGLEYVPVPSDVEYTKIALHEYDVAHHVDGITQVHGLLDTLPRIYSYEGKIIVVKYGGSALAGSEVIDTILEDVAALRMAGAKVVLVHGGGKSITHWLERCGVETRFEQGYRVTDDTAMQVAEMTLSGLVNKHIVSDLFRLKVKGVGISGRDGRLFMAEKKQIDGVDLGHVGVITDVDTTLVHALLDAGFVPVVSPVAMGEDGQAYNINADDAAAALARALKAEKLVYLTDIDGILMDQSNEKTLLQKLTVSRAEELLESGMLTGGMVPKINNCIQAINAGVKRVVILDGRVEHTILLESVSHQMMGTVIVPDEAQ